MENWTLELLFDFKRGVPSVYGVMLGDREVEAADIEYALQEKDVEEYNVKDLLEEYDIFIEFMYGGDHDTVDEMDIRIPFDAIEVDNIKQLYGFFLCKMGKASHSDKFTYNNDDELEDVEIFIEDAYFRVDMTVVYRNSYYLEIEITPKIANNYRLYQTLAFIAREGDKNLLDYADNMINNPDLNGEVHPYNDMEWAREVCRLQKEKEIEQMMKEEHLDRFSAGALWLEDNDASPSKDELQAIIERRQQKDK